MKKLLVLNGSHSDIPLIQAGKKLGYYVITSGNRPDLIGHAYGDKYIYGDFSKPEEMYEIFKGEGLDAVCSCANDFGIITAAYLSEKLDLPGHDSYETTLTLHHKDRFKQFSREHHICTPLAKHYDNINNALEDRQNWKYPVIVKPIDLTGGKGVGTAQDEVQYEEAVKKAMQMSPSGRIVAEPFIEGTQHSFSTFLVQGKVAAYFSDNEYSYLNPYLVSTSAGPATDVQLVEKTLISEAEKIAALLGLKDGVFHYQYLLSGGAPHIIEITRRCSGDMYPVPVEHALGIPWAEWIVRAECGLECDSFPKEHGKQTLGGRHCIMGEKNGIVKDVYISPELQSNIYDEFLWWKPGTEITNYMVDKLGILFLEYATYDEMKMKSEHITDYIKVIYE